MKCCKDKSAVAHPHSVSDIPKQKGNEVCTGACEACTKKKQKKGNVPLKVIMLSSLLLASLTSFAQDTPQAGSSWADPFNHPMLPIYVTMAFVCITILLLITVTVYLVKVLNVIVKDAEKESAAKSGIEYILRPSWLEKMWQQLNATVPVANEADIDLGHNFDGIRELDNHLPPWWKGLFYGTIIWAGVYLILYHITPVLPLAAEEYTNELAAAEEQARILRASGPAAIIDENTLVFDNDAEIISKGKIVFASSNCGSCHRNDGGGNKIGPNLTDEYWLHGGSIRNIFATINRGVIEKGMPAWGKVMSAEDVRNVAFYIMSLHDSNPKDPRTPQGDLFKIETQSKPADSLKVQAMNSKP